MRFPSVRTIVYDANCQVKDGGTRLKGMRCLFERHLDYIHAGFKATCMGSKTHPKFTRQTHVNKIMLKPEHRTISLCRETVCAGPFVGGGPPFCGNPVTSAHAAPIALCRPVDRSFPFGVGASFTFNGPSCSTAPATFPHAVPIALRRLLACVGARCHQGVRVSGTVPFPTAMQPSGSMEWPALGDDVIKGSGGIQVSGLRWGMTPSR
jgi:hypothetical protein